MRLYTAVTVVGNLCWIIPSRAAANTTLRRTNLQDAGWRSERRTTPGEPIALTITLKPGVVYSATDHLLDVSDPGSDNYGQYWSASQVAQAFAPSTGATEAVEAWLKGAGIDHSNTSWSRSRNRLHLNVEARVAEGLLSTEAHWYHRAAAEHGLVGYDEYYIPDSVSKHIYHVLPSSIHTPLRRHRHIGPRDRNTSKRPKSPISASYTASMSPAYVRALYNIPLEYTHHPSNSLGIFLPAWSGWIGEDLDSFFRQFQSELVGARPILQPISGGYRQLDYQIDAFNLEANLDFEYAMSLAYPQPVTNLQVGSKDHPGNLNIMLAAFSEDYCDALDPDIDLIPSGDGLDCGTVEPPSVISISWAWAESDFPPEYLERQCLEFLKLGLRGVTVLVSTGDAGPAKHPDGTCSDAGAFEPSWPSACPWVTAVGGTAVVSGGVSAGPDGTGDPDPSSDRIVAWRNQPSSGLQPLRAGERVYRRRIRNATRSSGGGFSNLFAAPGYQIKEVQEYLDGQEEHLGPLTQRFSATGRGYPDVSAVGAGVQVVTGGELKSVFGTSASAPIFASVIAKINDARLRAGKGPVGFINPVLYSHPEMMNDVVDGANAGCGVDEAFRAAGGWDAVTGLGSPAYHRMRDVFLGLP